MVLLELDRRHRLIAEIGGDPPSNDTLVNVLWMTMDPGSRSHISGKIDAASNVKFQEMKEAIMKHATLVGATSGGGVSKSTTAMDVSSIGSVTDTAQNQSAGEPPAVDWAMGETGWPMRRVTKSRATSMGN